MVNNFKDYSSWTKLGEGTYSTVYQIPDRDEVLKVPKQLFENSIPFKKELHNFCLTLFWVRKKDTEEKSIHKTIQVVRNGDVSPLGKGPVPGVDEKFYNNEMRRGYQVLNRIHAGSSSPLTGIEAPPTDIGALEKERLYYVTKKYDGDLLNLPHGVNKEKFARDLLHGLACVIEKRVLYLDIKVENCLRKADNAVLSDFGRTTVLPAPDELTDLLEAKEILGEAHDCHQLGIHNNSIVEYLHGQNLIKHLVLSAETLDEFKRVYKTYLETLERCQVLAVGLTICKMFGIKNYPRVKAGTIRGCPDELKQFETPMVSRLNYTFTELQFMHRKEPLLKFVKRMIHYKPDQRPSLQEIKDFIAQENTHAPSGPLPRSLRESGSQGRILFPQHSHSGPEVQQPQS